MRCSKMETVYCPSSLERTPIIPRINKHDYNRHTVCVRLSWYLHIKQQHTLCLVMYLTLHVYCITTVYYCHKIYSHKMEWDVMTNASISHEKADVNIDQESCNYWPGMWLNVMWCLYSAINSHTSHNAL